VFVIGNQPLVSEHPYFSHQVGDAPNAVEKQASPIRPAIGSDSYDDTAKWVLFQILPKGVQQVRHDLFQVCELFFRLPVFDISPKTICHLSVKFFAPMFDFVFAQSLGEAGLSVQVIVVVEAEKGQIVLYPILVITVHVGDLSLLDLVATLQPEAQATAAPALGQDVFLGFVRDRFPRHELASVTNTGFFGLLRRWWLKTLFPGSQNA
jgi:hypothetical protein